MSQVEYSSDGEFEMVIAAAAYAIASMDDESLLNKERAAEEMKISDTSKSKGEGNTSKRINSRRSFGWFSSKEEKYDSKSAGDKVTRKSAISDQRLQDDPTVNRKSTEKTKSTIPTIKKATTFTDKHLNDTGSKKFGSGNAMTPGQKPYISKKLSTLSSDTKKKEGNSARSTNKETKADAWEKAEMEKIKKRHEKTESEILEWETEEKKKADLQMEQKLKGIKQRRTKAMEEFNNEISRINEHCARERATTDERKRNDELKLREKAKKDKINRGNSSCMRLLLNYKDDGRPYSVLDDAFSSLPVTGKFSCQSLVTLSIRKKRSIRLGINVVCYKTYIYVCG